MKYLPRMKLRNELVQEIAVFGESGSGKTVMLSSFFGASQEPEFLRSSLYKIVAESPRQRDRLHRNYLGMKEDARRPEPNRFSSEPFSFLVKVKSENAKAHGAQHFDALRLVWHDYPGEWFEQDVSGQTEAQNRVDTFRALLGSDVALLLVDGQQLLDNSGEEERYLKKLLRNYRGLLESLEGELLVDGKLVEFPRIWILALSKADVLPELDVFRFRDLIRKNVAEDLDELRKVLASLVQSSDALSVGEDFVLLSSAKFEANRIEVTERVGLDLVLPLAATLPLERHLQWVAKMQLAPNVLEDLLDGIEDLAAALLGAAKAGKFKIALAKAAKFAKVGKAGKAAGGGSGWGAALLALDALLPAAVKLGGDKLREKNQEARDKGDYMAAVLTGFRQGLEEGEEKRVLLRGDG